MSEDKYLVVNYYDSFSVDFVDADYKQPKGISVEEIRDALQFDSKEDAMNFVSANERKNSELFVISLKKALELSVLKVDPDKFEKYLEETGGDND